jgi:hypothetical protein
MSLQHLIEHEVMIHAAQNSKAWDKVRLGRFTGSGLGKLFTEPKTKSCREAAQLSQTAITYIEEKAMEVITGESQGEFSSRATDWGNEWEEHALKEIAKAIGSSEDKTKLKPNFKLYGTYSGASPDAYMEYKGTPVGVELKCPFNSVNHMRHSRVTSAEQLKEHDSDYYWQVQSNIFFHKMPLWLFCSYDPRQPEHRRLHIAEIYAVPEDHELLLHKMEKAEAMKQELIQYWLAK